MKCKNSNNQKDCPNFNPDLNVYKRCGNQIMGDCYAVKNLSNDGDHDHGGFKSYEQEVQDVFDQLEEVFENLANEGGKGVWIYNCLSNAFEELQKKKENKNEMQ